MNYIVGLTGGIGSGKTTVANCFAKLGIRIVDTDIIARELTAAHGEAMPIIRQRFGGKALAPDGGLDRALMRQLAFSDYAIKAELEQILHPLIREKSRLLCAQNSSSPYVMLVVPLLVESRYYRESVQRILLVDCEESMQISRVKKRNGLLADQIQAIMATQASRKERLAVADDVIVNNGLIDKIGGEVAALDRKYREFAVAFVEQTGQKSRQDTD